MKKIRIIILTILVSILSLIGILQLPYFKPNLKEVLNPVTNLSVKNWEELESKVAIDSNKNLYWGDLHVHTNLSFDAYLSGTIANPSNAYEFAKGLPIEVFGKPVKIERALDFSAVTDHAELIGELYTIQNPNAPRHNRLVPKFIRSIYSTNDSLGVDTTRQRFIFNQILKRGGKRSPAHPKFFAGYETTKKAWQINIDAAEEHYNPGEFTTFAGYEWSLLEGSAHLHRNIIFKDMNVPIYPMSSLELTNELQLWKYLDSITKVGSTVIAIPHNTNLAEGKAFQTSSEEDGKINKAYVQLRQDYEPLIEVHQAKGNSEVHAAFWKNDEFAGFENYAGGLLAEQNYVRYALKKGLEIENKTGINPFKYGMIGSTDTHSASPGNVEESDTFIANHGILDYYNIGRLKADWALDQSKKVYEVINPGGLVAVWANANTRPQIYNALKQKEVYATSGSRITLRFFGGYNFTDEYSSSSQLVEAGYKHGVPMGSDLPPNDSLPPTFLIWAKRDSISANLDRVQIIKGWHKDGPMHETIYNIGISDHNNSINSNQAFVDTITGQFYEQYGEEEFLIKWTDPEFDPNASAFYYVRVIENPTANWKLWDKIRYGTKYPDGTKYTTQERAWSSPIWYTPIK